MSKFKLFLNYVTNSIGAMLFTALYFVIDGIFVGNGVGDLGLAAVNLAVPYVSILTAITMMITMGGASLAAINIGKNNYKKANNYFNTSFFLIIIFSFFISIISILFSKQIAYILGASDSLVNDTATYLKYYILFGIFFSSSMCLAAFVRNDGNLKLAFIGMVVGAISNITLDYIFIFPLEMGVKGAAIASGLGQILSCLVLSFHFILKKGTFKIKIPKLNLSNIKEISIAGIPEFITQMSNPIVTFCYNLLVIKFLGDLGVASFSIINYLLVITIAVFTGLGQGLQPLISVSRGENNIENEKYYFQLGLKSAFIISTIIYLIFLILGKPIIGIFSQNDIVINNAYNCIIIFSISFIPQALNVIFTTYNLSIKNTNKAIIIALLRSFIFAPIFIFLMPLIFGEKMLYSGIIIAETLTLIYIIISSKYKKTNGTS